MSIEDVSLQLKLFSLLWENIFLLSLFCCSTGLGILISCQKCQNGFIFALHNTDGVSFLTWKSNTNFTFTGQL